MTRGQAQSMADSSNHPTQLQEWLQRIRSGDLSAREEMFRSICGRLEHLARRMLKSFPLVRRCTDTDDVLQSALLRLLRALEQIEPASEQDLVNLAAVQIRRELLDLARRVNGENAPEDPVERAAPGEDSGEMDRWCAFHEEVEKLPVEEREVVGLIFYHGWTQAEVAELFQVCERTVRRRWETALAKLRHVLGDR
jgi:RNA polymerase sigma factor (sigma-70 family)